MCLGFGSSAHHTGDAERQQSECNDGQNDVDMFVRNLHLGAKIDKKCNTEPQRYRVFVFFIKNLGVSLSLCLGKVVSLQTL